MGVPQAKGALMRLYKELFKSGRPENANFLVTELLPQLRAYTDTYTTDQLIDLILREYAMFMRHPDHTLVTSVADASAYVPKRKSDTQSDRLEAWKKLKPAPGQPANEPYPPDSKIVPEGVLVDAKENRVEKLDTSRLSFSRSLRREFFERLCVRALTYPFPSYSFLLLDLGLPDGPVLIHSKKSWSWKHVAPAIGEGEMLALYWTRFLLDSFDKAHVLLKTVDSDVLPIAFNMYTTDKSRPFNVTWIHLTDQHVNLKELFDCMLVPHKSVTFKGCVWSSRSFLGACALSGSDYTDKADLLAGIGPGFLFDAALELSREAKHEAEAKTEEEYFRLILSRVYKKKGKSSAPMMDTKADRYRYGLEEYVWVTSYWRALVHGKFDLGPSLRQRENKPVPDKPARKRKPKESTTEEVDV